MESRDRKFTEVGKNSRLPIGIAKNSVIALRKFHFLSFTPAHARKKPGIMFALLIFLEFAARAKTVEASVYLYTHTRDCTIATTNAR